MAKKLLVFLMILVACVTVFVACGEPAETTAPTTTPAGTTTIKDESTTTTTPPTTTTPEVTTTIDISTFDPVEAYKYENDAIWCGPIHAGVVYTDRADKDNASVKHTAFRFGYGSDNGIFGNDPDTGVPGIQLTKPDRLYIKEYGVEDAEYTMYEIEYYEVPNWWEVWFVPKGFVPEDGKSYLLTLFVQSDDNLAHVYPESVLFWETYPDEPWTYEAPPPVTSPYGDIKEMVPDINDRTQLFLHDANLTVTAEGHLRYGFKSDNNPFADPPADADGTQLRGLSFTREGKVFINGEAYEIENYTTVDWWIIEFDIKNFTPVEGTEYEVLFTVDSADDTGDYCKNALGYFALNTAVLLAAAAE